MQRYNLSDQWSVDPEDPSVGIFGDTITHEADCGYNEIGAAIGSKRLDEKADQNGYALFEYTVECQCGVSETFTQLDFVGFDEPADEAKPPRLEVPNQTMTAALIQLHHSIEGSKLDACTDASYDLLVALGFTAERSEDPVEGPSIGVLQTLFEAWYYIDAGGFERAVGSLHLAAARAAELEEELNS